MAESPSSLVRSLQPRLTEALADSPVVLVHGPRQSGKTTLARTVCEPLGYRYLSFDDDVLRASAQADPAGFVLDLPDRTILDEVQRCPSIVTSLKHAIDQRRQPGRFVLTGSTNVMLLPTLTDSLAGRMEVLRLHPLSQSELARRPQGSLAALLQADPAPASFPRLGAELARRIAAGGYPAALQRVTHARRVRWYRDYIDALVQRDVRDFSRIGSLDTLPRLLAAAASQSARLLNVTELAAPFHLSRPTIRDYLTVLEQVFLVDELPAWHSNRLNRLVKTAKLHMGDSGLACALLGIDGDDLRAEGPLYGQMLETFVFQELRRQSSALEQPASFYHFRDKDGIEVDIVIELGRKTMGIEIKASSTVVDSDFKGLRQLQHATGARFARGILFYDGERVARFGQGLFAVPITSLWTG